MNKKEEFKAFVKIHPELVRYIKDKETTWQELYEIYDMYGDDEKAWEKYQERDNSKGISELSNLVKNINMDNVQKYINNAQKAINVISELTSKTPSTKESIITSSSKPLNKFFGD